MGMAQATDKPHLDKDTLRREYIENGRTAQELADEWGVSKGRIYQQASKFELTKQGDPDPDEKYTSFRVERSALLQAKAMKEEGETWSDYVVRKGEESVTTGSVDREALIADIRELLDERESASVDVDELAERLSKKLGSDLEMASYRGSRDALEEASR